MRSKYLLISTQFRVIRATEHNRGYQDTNFNRPQTPPYGDCRHRLTGGNPNGQVHNEPEQNVSKTKQSIVPRIPTQSQLRTQTVKQACALAERECMTADVEQAGVRMLQYLDAQCEDSPGSIWMNIVFPVCNELVDPPLSVRDHTQQRILSRFTADSLNNALPRDISVVSVTADGVRKIETAHEESVSLSPNPAIVTDDGRYGGTVRVTQEITDDSQPSWPSTDMSEEGLLDCLISYGDVHTDALAFEPDHAYNMNTRVSAPFPTTNSFALVASNIAQAVTNRRDAWTPTLDAHHTTEVLSGQLDQSRDTPVTVLSGPESSEDTLLNKHGCWTAHPTVETDRIAIYVGGSQQSIKYVATVEQSQPEKTYVAENNIGSEPWVSETFTNSRRVLTLSNVSELDTPVAFNGRCSKMNRLGHHVETTMGSLIDAEQMTDIPSLSD